MNFVKSARLELGLTQRAFALAIGVERTTVSEWEREDSDGPGDLNRAKINALLNEARRKSTVPDTGEQTAPKVAAVNVTVRESQTLVAVRLEHQKYAAEEYRRSWDYSVRVANIVMDLLKREFNEGSLARQEEIDREVKLLQAHQREPIATKDPNLTDDGHSRSA